MRRLQCRRFVWLLALALPLLFLASAEARAQLQITSQDGKSSLHFGFLAQPQAEWLDTAVNDATVQHTSQNLFLRRIRLIFGGNVSEKWSYFIETDSPNLGKGNPDGTKDAGNVFIQDVILTWSAGDAFKVDTGELLLPLSHNTQQSAASLLAVDYGPNSFNASTPTDSRTGRDYGIQFRGYPFDKHLEYRLAVTEGHRGVNDVNPFRLTGRVVYYPFDADTGFFYLGTGLGAKKILAIGASYDMQREYKSYAVDAFWDWGFAGGSGVTVQTDWLHYDGGTFLTSLPKQNTILVEAGYYIKAAAFGPFVQYAKQDFDEETINVGSPTASHRNNDKALFGLAYWGNGHKYNVKLGVARLSYHNEPGIDLANRTQVVLQAQIFTY